MKKNEFGVFEITVPAKDGQVAIPHNSKIKVRILFLVTTIAHRSAMGPFLIHSD
jgi:hypothetical protein